MTSFGYANINGISKQGKLYEGNELDTWNTHNSIVFNYNSWFEHAEDLG